MATNMNLRLPEQNNVILVGRLTHDPEVRFTSKNQTVCRFNVAVNRRYKDTSGNWQDNVSFIPVVVWGEAATRCGERLKKGYPVHVEGRLQSRSWETKEGQKRNSLDVIARRVQFLSRVSEDTEIEATEASPSVNAGVSNEEEIPF
ncbi:MAG: single-stranded DNA-binding protein [Elusimicrobia bacterium]|nr:single-stranded DNA-binding protein [Candidatus Liberimonas magnetica]